MKRTFRSDNNAGVCPEALAAINHAAEGHALGYGGDDGTTAAAAALCDLFGEGARAFFVATGTAANTLAVAALTRPWQRVLCYEHAHWNDDESTAPERFTGCRTTTIRPAAGQFASKLTAEDVRAAAATSRGDVHQPQPGVLTISNPTEFGEVYSPDELKAVCAAAHELGYRVHIDGARFANAVAAHCGGDPANAPAAARALGPDAGVDALSFGGTKNGLALGEAVLFFSQGDGRACADAAEHFPYLRKSAGHLLSKHRYVSAPFLAVLRGGAWVRHAARANAAAARLGNGLRDAGFDVRFPVDSNAVFPVLSEPQDAALRAGGHEYYPFGPARWRTARLMCSFDTTDEDVDAFVRDARAVQPSGAS